MARGKRDIAVGVHDCSTDWGTIGYASTERGAIRMGRKWARDHSTQPDYEGYGPVITYAREGEYPESVRAW